MMFSGSQHRGAAIIDREGDIVRYHAVSGAEFDMKALLHLVSQYIDPQDRQGEVTQSLQLKVHPAFYPTDVAGFTPAKGDWFEYDGVVYVVDVPVPSGLGIVRLLVHEEH